MLGNCRTGFVLFNGETEVNIPLGKPKLPNLLDPLILGVSLHPPLLLGTGVSLPLEHPKQGAEDAVQQPKIFLGGQML